MSAALKDSKSLLKKCAPHPLTKTNLSSSKVQILRVSCLKNRSQPLLLTIVWRRTNTRSIFLCAPFAVFVNKATYEAILTRNWLKSAPCFDKIVINRNKLTNWKGWETKPFPVSIRVKMSSYKHRHLNSQIVENFMVGKGGKPYFYHAFGLVSRGKQRYLNNSW